MRVSVHRAASAVFVLALGACTVGPRYTAPDVVGLEPERFVDAGEVLAPADWWRAFNDPVLDALIEDALVANRDLRVADANVRAAGAAFGERSRDLGPVVRAGADYRRGRTSADGLGAMIPGFPTGTRFPDTDLFDSGLFADWEIDFWGRVRHSVAAARATYEGAEADRRNASVIVTADVAAAYVRLRGAERQLAVARANADRQFETRTLTESLEAAGRASALDSARARAQHEATLARLPPLRARIARERRRLAVLTGRAPDSLNNVLDDARGLPRIPEGAPAGDPALILRQRPDIVKAERDLAVAAARVGVSTADLFPRVRLVGAFGASSATLSRFGTGPSIDFGFGPTIEWAAFDLGRVRARIRQSEATAEAALARYEQVALQSLEETANAFTSLARERESNARLARAANDSADAEQLANSRFKAGLDGFLTVLDAERRRLEDEAALAESDTRTLEACILVYRTLGGGWRAAAAPTTDAASAAR